MNNKNILISCIYPIINTIILFLISNNVILSILINVVIILISLLMIFIENKEFKKYKLTYSTNRFISLFVSEYTNNSDIINSLNNIKSKIEKEVKEIIDSQIIEDGDKFLSSLQTYFTNDRYLIFIDNLKKKKFLKNIKNLCDFENKTIDSILKKKNYTIIKNIAYWIIPLAMLLMCKLMFMKSFNNLFLNPGFNIFLIVLNIFYLINIFYIRINIFRKNIICNILTIILLTIVLIGLILSIIIKKPFFVILFLMLLIFSILTFIFNSNYKKDIKAYIDSYKNYGNDFLCLSIQKDEKRFKEEMSNLDINKLESKKISALNNYLLFPLLGGMTMIIVICILIMDMIGGMYNAF